ncbi:MAG: cyclodeaminase/cyclohydrolase family protein [Deltaproteobacteria bacterium]|jgi:formiminotetrahydrofolate cyclodeaminase|nr:cyclodeaminase/cyclohydrolase family protein [Deltaproteobacteria bacterium]
MLMELNGKGFLDILASKAPAPGGGSVSAYNGALAASLMAMVAELSLARQELSDNHDRYRQIILEAKGMGTKLAEMVDLDAQAFNEVMAAFGRPKSTDQEKAVRQAAIQTGYKTAINAPMTTARLCLQVSRIGAELAKMGFNPSTASDLGVALQCCRTGFNGAMMNVAINLPSLKDVEYLTILKREVKDMGIKFENNLSEASRVLEGQLKLLTIFD